MTNEARRSIEGRLSIKDATITPPLHLLDQVLEWNAGAELHRRFGMHGNGVSGVITEIHGHISLIRQPVEQKNLLGVKVLLNIGSGSLYEHPKRTLREISDQLVKQYDDSRAHPSYIDQYTDSKGVSHLVKPRLLVPFSARGSTSQLYMSVGWHGRSLEVSMQEIEGTDLTTTNPNSESTVAIMPELLPKELEHFFLEATDVVKAAHSVHKEHKPHGKKGAVLTTVSTLELSEQ